MTVAEGQQRTYTLYSGEAAAPDTDTAAVILAYFNIFKDDWFDEDVDWDSTREMIDIGTVTATDTFDLDDSVTNISKQEGDYVIITDSEDRKSYYTLVKANKLFTANVVNPVAVVGRTLVFKTPFTASSPQLGATISVPHYVRPDDVANANDELQVDNPMYQVYMAANELSAQDVTKTDQAPRQLAMATKVMEKMKQNNGAQVEEVYRGTNIFYGENL
jgi:hypothetical protein